MRAPRLFARTGALLAVIAGVLALTGTAGATGTGQSFTFLQAGFTQDLFGTNPSFLGGIAFAPDGDVWADPCAGGGASLFRYDLQSTMVVNTTTIHPFTTVPSNAACGLTNHPNGSLYTNTSGGVVRLDGSTGAFVAGPFGPPGDALGIAPDPISNNLVYVGSGGTLYEVDPGLSTSTTFSTAVAGHFIDGIAWSPDGNFLFLSDRSPSFALTILDRMGNLVQSVPMTSEPDGISFHASTPKFVVTNNTNGTMTRFDFPADDFTQAPVQSVFASGGFRGDLSQVGADGCIYLSQDGTRYDDGTTTGENSVVRICGGFAPPPGVVPALSLAPANATNPVGSMHTVIATYLQNGTPAANEQILFSVSGANTASGSGTTDVAGQTSFTYTGTSPGDDTITACDDANGNGVCDRGELTATATKHWIVVDADVGIVKSGPALVQDGGTITYTLAASNGGPATATNVVVSDTLPAGEAFVSASAGCSYTAGTVTCIAPSIAPLGSASFTITVSVSTAAGAITNTATVTADQPDPSPGNNSSSSTATVNHPPSCAAASAGPDLWPPNHKLSDVRSITGLTDPDGNPIAVTITSIWQDEPTNGLGDGDTGPPDAVILGANSFQVRAERSGLGNGRVYYVNFTASDGAGGTCSGTATIGVPHDQAHATVGDGQLYPST